ncbi:hypothetical protein RI367_003298 [Sorochytrium milnesiophthora]
MSNQAAWFSKPGAPLEVAAAPMPTAGPNEIVVKNAAIALNPVDFKVQDSGFSVRQWPAVLGCDVAGVVQEVGSDVKHFKKGDRVIGYTNCTISTGRDVVDQGARHTVGLLSGRPQDGAFALYSTVQATKAAILPDNIPFTDGVVLPLALETAVGGLFVKEATPTMGGALTPALALPYPSLKDVPQTGKTLVVYGGSSSVGTATIQLASAAGVKVIAIAGKSNADLCKRCGAAEVFDHKDPAFVDKVVQAVGTTGFVGVYDAISTPETYTNSLAILAKLGGGHLACVLYPPATLPSNVKAGFISGINEAATPVWTEYVTPALESGELQCLPKPTIVGKGLESINDGLKKLQAGVSATKLVVEL